MLGEGRRKRRVGIEWSMGGRRGHLHQHREGKKEVWIRVNSWIRWIEMDSRRGCREKEREK